MELSIRSEGFALTDALDEFVRDRLRFAMARFHNAVSEIRVRLSDDNGPRGGTDKRCRFEVRIPGMRPLLIDECNQDLYAAIGRGSDRMQQRIVRALERRRTRRR
jgi:putative sigma-54 modulation protein